MLEKKYYDGTQVHRIISEEVKDYDTIMKILKRFADEPSALGTDLAEVGTDCISRQAAIDALNEQIWQCDKALSSFDISMKDEYAVKVERASLVAYKEQLEALPSAQPDNQINLCDSCDYSYPDCPSKNDDVIFGNGIGNDNICACNKYKPSAQPMRKTGKWKRRLVDSGFNADWQCSECGWKTALEEHGYNFCPMCGSYNGGENEI